MFAIGIELVILAIVVIFVWGIPFVMDICFAGKCFIWLNRLICFRNGKQQPDGWAAYELSSPDCILVVGCSQSWNDERIRLSYYVDGRLSGEMKLEIYDRNNWNPSYWMNGNSTWGGWFGRILADRLFNVACRMVAHPMLQGSLDPSKAPTIAFYHRRTEVSVREEPAQ